MTSLSAAESNCIKILSPNSHFDNIIKADVCGEHEFHDLQFGFVARREKLWLLR
jgi:hypothetical protein